ncbi:MAG: hypothetical protein KF773_16420 [Deltaproteobacteria bacterium]|nr:hypothetical protein [Deltaproteobacteria bacterium]
MFHCLKCRLAQRADVVTRARRPPPPARSTAGRADANTRVAMMLALKRCPRCGHYDKAVAQHNRYNLRFSTIASSIVFAIVALSLFAIPSVPPIAFAIATSACAIGFVLLVRGLYLRFPVSSERFVVLRESASPGVRDAWY